MLKQLMDKAFRRFTNYKRTQKTLISPSNVMRLYKICSVFVSIISTSIVGTYIYKLLSKVL